MKLGSAKLLTPLSLAAALLLSAAVGGDGAPATRPGGSRLRRPVALVAAEGLLFAANRDAGTVSVIDPVRAGVAEEVEVAGRLSDMTAVGGGAVRSLLVTDVAGGSLVRLERQGASLRVAGRVDVGVSPVSVCVAPDGGSCFVALLWPRRVAVVSLGDVMRVERTVDLPFAPREQWVSPDGSALVVADAFGGNVAVIDLPAGRVRALRSLPGHNIRGITASTDGGELLFSHLVLDEALETTSSRVSWGGIVAGMVRSVALGHLLEAPGGATAGQVPTPVTRWSVFPTGEQGRGGGDPGEVIVTKDGTVLVALSGVNEVAVRGRQGVTLQRLAVGRGPTSLAASPDGRLLYVANTFDDSVSIIDLHAWAVVRTMPLGERAPLTDVQRGEMLFHDARLSLDGWYSCHSCHTDGHTNNLRNDNFTDSSFGTPKRIPSLLGTGVTRPWAWDGSVVDLEDQGGKSILGTMHGQTKGASPQNVKALAAYLRSLPPPPSVEAARGTLDLDAVRRGKEVFEALDCARCHAPPAYTAPRTYDVGLPDERGKARFNPPSLLGVGQRDSLLHDGRARTLAEVFTRFKHPDGDEPPAGELEDLLAFLRSL